MKQRAIRRLVGIVETAAYWLQEFSDELRDEYIRCETCGRKMSGPPCHGIQP